MTLRFFSAWVSRDSGATMKISWGASHKATPALEEISDKYFWKIGFCITPYEWNLNRKVLITVYAAAVRGKPNTQRINWLVTQWLQLRQWCVTWKCKRQWNFIVYLRNRWRFTDQRSCAVAWQLWVFWRCCRRSRRRWQSLVHFWWWGFQ